MSSRKGPVDNDGALASVRTGRVMTARKLLQAKHRRDTGLFLVEGPQAVREAAANAAIREVFVTPEAHERHHEIISVLDGNATVTLADDDAVASLCGSTTPQGIVAVCTLVPASLGEVLANKPSLLVGLMYARDPGNVGSVLRVADAAGADGVVLSVESVDHTNDKVIRSSTGSLFHLPVVAEVEPLELIRAAKVAGLQVFAADATGIDLTEVEQTGALTAPTLWLFGNEAWGVPDEILAAADRVVRVPIYGAAESLNLATAAAVCLYSSARAIRTGSTTRS